MTDSDRFWENMAIAGLILKIAFLFTCLFVGLGMGIFWLFQNTDLLLQAYNAGAASQTCLPSPRFDPPL